MRHSLINLWLAVCVWMSIIFLFSSIPGGSLPTVHVSHVDKVVHFFEFFVLGLLLINAVWLSSDRMRYSPAVAAVIIMAALFAASDEIHQRFVPGRTMDIFDFFVDLTGSIVAIFVHYKKRII